MGKTRSFLIQPLCGLVNLKVESDWPPRDLMALDSIMIFSFNRLSILESPNKLFSQAGSFFPLF